MCLHTRTPTTREGQRAGRCGLELFVSTTADLVAPTALHFARHTTHTPQGGFTGVPGDSRHSNAVRVG